MAAGDHQLALVLTEQVEHVGKQAFVVLEVAVHDGDVRGGGGKGALDHGAGQSAAADAPDAAHARVGGAEAARRIGGAIRAVVVHEDHLPGDATQRLVELGDEGADVGRLVEARHDDGEFRSGQARRRGAFDHQRHARGHIPGVISGAAWSGAGGASSRGGFDHSRGTPDSIRLVRMVWRVCTRVTVGRPVSFWVS